MIFFVLHIAVLIGIFVAGINGLGYRTVGSSGVAPQMVFLPPYTQTAVFIDKSHPNYGYPSVNLTTGQAQEKVWLRPGTKDWVFGAEYNWKTQALRALNPIDDTSCSIGAFLADGTLINLSGAQPDNPEHVGSGFNQVRSYAPGPCPKNNCTTDWVLRSTLQKRRWYPSAQTLPSGDILVVGGADVGFLIYNFADVNVPSYEVLDSTSLASTKLVNLPILNMTAAQNQDPDYAYNMYPMLHLLPNPAAASHIFTLDGNRAEVWDYDADTSLKSLPDIPVSARTFPSSAMNVLLPIVAPENMATVLVCGGSSNDKPNPLTMDDCYTIMPNSANPTWIPTDNLPNGGQTMSNGVLLPDGTVLILNGAHKGCAGSWMAEDPVNQPVIYNPAAPAGQKFNVQPATTTIARMYHSVAILLPSGEVLVAGSNTAVHYSRTGMVPTANYPIFHKRGTTAFLHRQQYLNSSYPTEYRVEMFSPAYMSEPRPAITAHPANITHNALFNVSATLNGTRIEGTTKIVLNQPGFSTHGQVQGQRMAVMEFTQGTDNTFSVRAPLNAAVMQPGVYLLWVVVDGVPSVAEWIKLT